MTNKLAETRVSDAFLRQLELEHPGYEAKDTGREIVFSPISDMTPEQRALHEQRLGDFAASQAATL